MVQVIDEVLVGGVLIWKAVSRVRAYRRMTTQDLPGPSHTHAPLTHEKQQHSLKYLAPRLRSQFPQKTPSGSVKLCIHAVNLPRIHPRRQIRIQLRSRHSRWASVFLQQLAVHGPGVFESQVIAGYGSV